MTTIDRHIVLQTNNAKMKNVLQTAQKISASDLNVIIVGEHGTGKELLARMIHQMNEQRSGTFCPFDSAAIQVGDIEKELFGVEELTPTGVRIQRGAFEEAEAGTLFLHDIDALPASTQMKISRAIEFHSIHRVGTEQMIPVNVRIIATLSKPAEPLITEGILSKEMYYRISPLILELPPLRQRKEDIPMLIEKFLSSLRLNDSRNILGVSHGALRLCINYDWPGNIRHLKNAIEYAFIMCSGEWILPEHFPASLRNNSSAKEAV
jgi:DNA-binding NtrC family response regulator